MMLPDVDFEVCSPSSFWGLCVLSFPFTYTHAYIHARTLFLSFFLSFSAFNKWMMNSSFRFCFLPELSIIINFF